MTYSHVFLPVAALGLVDMLAQMATDGDVKLIHSLLQLVFG